MIAPLVGAVALLLLVGGGSVLLTHQLSASAVRSASRTNPSPSPTSTPLAAPTNPPASPTGPSGSPIAPSAAAIVANVQVASGIDGSDHPTQVTDTVTAGQTLFITFDLHLNGQTGYVLATFYQDSQYLDKAELTVDRPDDLNGAIYATFSGPVANGAAELYWCQQADCSDRALAAVAHFTVTAASASSSASSSSSNTPSAAAISPMAASPAEQARTFGI